MSFLTRLPAALAGKTTVPPPPVPLPVPQLPASDVMEARDGSILVRIPAGEFEMGDGKDPDCPKHKVELSEYWMGVYCVTNRQYGKFVSETRHRVPDKADLGEAVWKNGQCPAEKLDHPVVCVSWDDGAAYAKWAGLSLPTEAQWEKAARGPGGLIYPWGNEWDQHKCRNHTNRGNDMTATVWEYPNGTSGYGTMQQSGNVWEWCADWYEDNYYEKGPAKDPGGPQAGSFRVLRGGSWRLGVASHFRGASRRRGVPADRFVVQGLRLVRNSP
ncbi:MAG: SUMF1/EgtB/PvdO family nonheme iron enzyme [Verrucomicrobia bacterium]|nr:SUMF1/EgtB/PvdO family nonheme iron enzyme [Verrucomicrobiota bacterium]